MSVGRDEKEARKAVEQALRRQAANAEFRRDIARLPQFHVESELPEQLASLLGEIDRAERRYR